MNLFGTMALTAGIGLSAILTAGETRAQNKPARQPVQQNNEFGLSDLLRGIFGAAAPTVAQKAKPAKRSSRVQLSNRSSSIKYDADGRAIEVPVVEVKRGRIPQSWDRQYYLEKAEAKRRARARDAGV